MVLEETSRANVAPRQFNFHHTFYTSGTLGASRQRRPPACGTVVAEVCAGGLLEHAQAARLAAVAVDLLCALGAFAAEGEPFQRGNSSLGAYCAQIARRNNLTLIHADCALRTRHAAIGRDLSRSTRLARYRRDARLFLVFSVGACRAIFQLRGVFGTGRTEEAIR